MEPERSLPQSQVTATCPSLSKFYITFLQFSSTAILFTYSRLKISIPEYTFWEPLANFLKSA